jgi:hypothetical protein
MGKLPLILKNYSNGASVKLPNRRVTVTENDKHEFYIQFKHADKNEDPNKPACEHICFKNKVRQTTIKISEEGMEAIVIAFMEYKRQQKLIKKHDGKVVKYVVMHYFKDGRFDGFLSAYTPSGALQFHSNSEMAIPFDTEEDCIFKHGEKDETGFYKIDKILVNKI